jgi:hypothetical protein
VVYRAPEHDQSAGLPVEERVQVGLLALVRAELALEVVSVRDLQRGNSIIS